MKTLRGAFYFVTLTMFSPYPKPEPRPKKQPKPLSNKRKPTGEWVMMLEIWEVRPHFCTNCPEWLGDDPQPHFFDHIIPKSRGEKYRLDKDNIQLLCFDCHYVKQNGTREQFDARKKL